MEIPPTDPARVRLLRIAVHQDMSQDAAVRYHPEVAPLLRKGWKIKSRMPRLVEGEGLQLFIVLTRPLNASM